MMIAKLNKGKLNASKMQIFDGAQESKILDIKLIKQEVDCQELWLPITPEAILKEVDR